MYAYAVSGNAKNNRIVLFKLGDIVAKVLSFGDTARGIVLGVKIQ
ncbi:hypothetical protein BMETH_396_1 [methanotrophic bacterial endosymbiont of Bathymodiolus sp.]|nr:hypothetical protein BMETH_396_1 [methanotrophic bacterial endosymbiont of Bathymodiolus sp.]